MIFSLQFNYKPPTNFLWKMKLVHRLSVLILFVPGLRNVTVLEEFFSM